MALSDHSQLDQYVQARADVLGGVPVFRNTRIPVKALFDYLRAGKTVGTFLADFDGVDPEAVRQVLMAAEEDVLRHVQAA